MTNIKSRKCTEVIKAMLELVPETEIKLIKDLNYNLKEAALKEPGNTIQWEKTSSNIRFHLRTPTEDWHFEVLSIFSGMSVEQIKAEVEKVPTRNNRI